MKAIKVLWLMLLLAMGGCSSSRNWDKAEIEQKVMESFNGNLSAQNIKTKCNSVHLVANGENRFTGFANFSDGSTKNFDVILDPKTGDFITR